MRALRMTSPHFTLRNWKQSYQKSLLNVISIQSCWASWMYSIVQVVLELPVLAPDCSGVFGCQVCFCVASEWSVVILQETNSKFWHSHSGPCWINQTCTPCISTVLWEWGVTYSHNRNTRLWWNWIHLWPMGFLSTPPFSLLSSEYWTMSAFAQMCVKSKNWPEWYSPFTLLQCWPIAWLTVTVAGRVWT